MIIRYRSSMDRKVGMYFAFFVVTLVGAVATFAILDSIERTDFESDSGYQSLIDDPTGAEIPDTRRAR